MFLGVLPPLTPFAEALWADLREVQPLAWCIEAVPSTAGPWPRVLLLVSTMAVPGEAHYTEVAALNPGMRAVAWGEL